MRNGTPVIASTIVAGDQDLINTEGPKGGDIKYGTLWYICKSYN